MLFQNKCSNASRVQDCLNIAKKFESERKTYINSAFYIIMRK